MKSISGSSIHWLVHGVILMVVVLLQSGCSSTAETRNASERPWNTPKAWEHGLPSGMYEGR